MDHQQKQNRNRFGVARVAVSSVAGVLILAAAATAWAAAGWSNFGTLKNVEVDSTTGAASGTATYVWFTTPPTGTGFAAPPACSGPQYVAMGSTENVKQLTALASQALLSGKPFQVRFTGDCVNATGSVVTGNAAGYARFDNASIGW